MATTESSSRCWDEDLPTAVADILVFGGDGIPLLSGSQVAIARLVCPAWARALSRSCRRLRPLVGRRASDVACPPTWASSFCNLQHILWPVSKLSDAGTDEMGINKLSSLKYLTSVAMSSKIKLHDICDVLEVVSSRITSLDLTPKKAGYRGISNREASVMFKSFRMPHLSSLTLEKCARVKDKTLSALSGLSSLTYLNVSGCTLVTDAGVAILSATLPRLAILNASYCWQLTDNGVRALQPLQSKLLDLSLVGCCCLTDDCLVALGPMTSLRTLRLQGNRFTDAGLDNLRHLVALSTLQMVACHKCTNTGMNNALQGLSSSLSSLDLTGFGQATATGTRTVAALSELRHLCLKNCCKLDDAAIACLEPLRHLSQLSLERCHEITDASLVCIGRIGALTELNVRLCSRLTGRGLSYLRILTELGSLDIRGCCDITLNAIMDFLECFPDEIALEMRCDFEHCLPRKYLK